MQWEFVVAILIAIPIIIFPAAFIWYLNFGGIFTAIKEARQRRAAREGNIRTAAESEQPVAVLVDRNN